jgi:tetratricopeptide (TPR) repeat protein
MRRALHRLTAGLLHTPHVMLLLFGLFTALMVLSLASPLQAQSNAAAADALLQSGKLSEARGAFEAVLNSDPSNSGAQHGEVAASERLALDARSAGRADDALQDLLRAQKFAPNDPRLLYDLGILEDEMQLFRDADRTLASLEQLHPSDPDPQVLYAIARVKIDLGQLSAAEEKMLAYLKMRPEDASAHYGLGRVYQLGFQFDKARAEFRRSIELQPVQTEAYYQLGDIALGQGAFDEAIAEFAKTLARDPKHGGALTGTGQAYFKQKQYQQAEEYLDQAIAAAPEYQAGHYYLGLTLARLGRKEESQRELDLATKLADGQSKRERGRLQLNPQATNP